jgi:glycosyltransferase involved in cell wall biosynthesis
MPFEDELQNNEGEFVRLNDKGLTHNTLVTKSSRRKGLSEVEIDKWLRFYTQTLDHFRPDIVWFYGGGRTSSLIPIEARIRGIKTAYYLVNENHHGTRWARDVDLILTDSHATKRLYAGRCGLDINPIGKFIDRRSILNQNPSSSSKYVTFINPSFEKGVIIVVCLAYLMEEKRPDIRFQVVESRGDWHEALASVTEWFGDPRTELTNVDLVPNTSDMKSVYEKTHLLLAPSLWFESGARVLVEAMMNGIPAIVTKHGGNTEMIGNGGVLLDLPSSCHEAPFTNFPKPHTLGPIIEKIQSLFDNPYEYQKLSDNAYRVAQERHDIERSTDRLIAAFTPLIDNAAGPDEQGALLRTWDKQGLATAMAHQRGSVAWLVARERHYGGLQKGIVRRTESERDPRTPDEYSAGFVEVNGKKFPKHIGGDRMAFDQHGYAPVYSSFLKPFYSASTTSGLTIIEVGIARGHGLAIWCDLFPDARVIGLDLDPDIFAEHRPVLEQRGAFQQNTPEVYAFDQFAPDRALLGQIASNEKIDIFIDDGAHTREAILGTLDAVKDHMSEGAVYIIEDFLGIEAEVGERLPGWRVLSHGLMTIATDLTSGVPDYVPSKRDYLSGALDAD